MRCARVDHDPSASTFTRIAKAIKPDYALSSHVAALGIVFGAGETLSPVFGNGSFIGEHGSWDGCPLNGYQVIFVPFVGGMPSGMPIPVVTDFQGRRAARSAAAQSGWRSTGQAHCSSQTMRAIRSGVLVGLPDGRQGEGI